MKNCNFAEVINKLTYADIELETKLKPFQTKAISKFINANFSNYIFEILSSDVYIVKIKLSEIDSDNSVLLHITTNLKGRKVCYLQVNDLWVDKENRFRECFCKMFQTMFNELTEPSNILDDVK